MIRRLTSEAMFPVGELALRVLRNPRHAECALHRHEFYELVLILGGRGRHLTDEGDFAVETGDVFLLRGDMAHGYADTDHMSLVNITFDPALLTQPGGDLRSLAGYHVLFRVEPKLRRQTGFRDRLRLSRGQLAEAATLVARIENEIAARKPGFRTMMCTHLVHLIVHLSRCYAGAGQPGQSPALRIGALLGYIERHFDEPLTVPQLAAMAAMSESAFSRLFRQVTGRTPLDYVIRLRVARAAERLRHDGISVTEAALACGFSDSNYFARQFRRVTGRSPRDIRRTATPPGTVRHAARSPRTRSQTW